MSHSGGERSPCALLVLSGLPGSGKTTIARSILDTIVIRRDYTSSIWSPSRAELVRYDDFLHAELTAADFSPEAWQRSRSSALDYLQKLLDQLLRDQPSKYTLVIADDNHHLRSMRHELYQAARDRGFAFLQLHVACSLEDALARNQRRSGLDVVPAEALRRMAAQLEPPQPERFAWEACSLTIHSLPTAGPSAIGATAVAVGGESHEEEQQRRPGPWSDEQVAALCGDLWRLWGPPPPPPPSEEELQRQRVEGQLANAASYLHGLDLRSRKALSEVVAAAPERGRAAVARGLNERRRALLQAVREVLHGRGQLQGRRQADSPGSPAGPVGGGERGGDAATDGTEEVLARLRALEQAFMCDAGM